MPATDLPLFDGETFDLGRDGERLGRQLCAVHAAMAGGGWHTLQSLAIVAR